MTQLLLPILTQPDLDPASVVEGVVRDRLVVSFFVPGEPAPGGSKTYIPLRYKSGKLVIKTLAGGKEFPVGKMIDAGKGNAKWKKCVATYARQAYSGPPVDCPLGLCIVFYRVRPKGHMGTGRNAGTIKASAPRWPAVMPDTTKLLRSTEDALTGIIWTDDARVVDGHEFKRYGNRPGAKVVVWRME